MTILDRFCLDNRVASELLSACVGTCIRYSDGVCDAFETLCHYTYIN